MVDFISIYIYIARMRREKGIIQTLHFHCSFGKNSHDEKC